MRKASLVERLGELPPGMSKADAQAILQFLYGAFDKRAAKQTEIYHPFVEGEEAPRITVSEFTRWLQVVAA